MRFETADFLVYCKSNWSCETNSIRYNSKQTYIFIH